MLPVDQDRRFTHDCELCQFLGQFDFDGSLPGGITLPVKTDLYVCWPDSPDPSIVARLGDQGHNYVSYPLDILETLKQPLKGTHGPAIMEGLRRFHARSETP